MTRYRLELGLDGRCPLHLGIMGWMLILLLLAETPQHQVCRIETADWSEIADADR